MIYPAVTIQITSETAPSTPIWMGEVAAFAQVLSHLGILKTIQDQVRFARARFGNYDVIDFVVVLIGYALSGEPTLQAFYERLGPFAEPFMALFGRNHLPHRSTLSRFLAALDQVTVEALRACFFNDFLTRSSFPSPGGLLDRTGASWLVIDVDATRQAARQRALPHDERLPSAHRRFDRVCKPGYTGRKRGEVVRTRTLILQAHTHQFLGTFSGAGNGEYRGELSRSIQTVLNYANQLELSPAQILLRLDGLYGNASVLFDVITAGLGVISRSRDYALLDRPAIKQALAGSPQGESQHPESGRKRALYDCGLIALASEGPELRLLVATHPATSSPPKVGVQRDGTVYELFVSTLPSTAFTAADVLDLYLHRGSFETVLADEDIEQESDRWVSHTASGQESFQILAQWVWNLRLELGQHLLSSPLRTTELAKALEILPQTAKATPALVEYAPPQFARPSFTHGFAGSAFELQADGTLRCPAHHPLYPQERRRERDGSLRVLYAARIGHCRACPLRCQCQESQESKKPRRVSAIFWPRLAPEASTSPPTFPLQPALPLSPLLWLDWPRCSLRRTWMRVLRSETVEISSASAHSSSSVGVSSPLIYTRAERAHYRLSWAQRLLRNARSSSAPPLTLTLHGLPATFAERYGFALRDCA